MINLVEHEDVHFPTQETNLNITNSTYNRVVNPFPSLSLFTPSCYLSDILTDHNLPLKSKIPLVISVEKFSSKTLLVLELMPIF